MNTAVTITLIICTTIVVIGIVSEVGKTIRYKIYQESEEKQNGA